MKAQSITTGTAESFKTFLTDEFIYIDKTGPISALASQKGSFLLTRPRRMGKSTMVATLEHLFTKGAVSGNKNLAWDGQWDDPYRYFVFHLDWSKFTVSSVESFEKGVTRYLKEYAKFFGISLPDDSTAGYSFECLINGCLEKLSDNSFLAQHPNLVEGEPPLSCNKVVLLIDEYDAPLSRNLDDALLIDRLREVYTEFFSIIKSLTCFRFVFITGVSSYAQTSIFSGPNQFINISLYKEYATCCGYTKAEIEHYFANELDRAQNVLNLESREKLFDQLSYYYDGYIFSDEEASYTPSEDKRLRLFSPVSISLFLVSPSRSFRAYWANTGGLSSFFLKMMKLCNRSITSNLLQTLYPNSINQSPELKTVLSEAITSFFPIFSLAINKEDKNQFNSNLIEVDVESLIVKFGNVKLLSQKNAVAILFQSGYLSIKKVVGSKAYLGLANHEVAQVLVKLLQDQLEEQEEEGKIPLSAADRHILYLLKHSEDVLTRLHQGGQRLCDLINDTFNSIDKKIFDEVDDEQVLTSILAYMLKVTGYNTLREVKSMFGIADIVIFKPNTDPLVPYVVLEFKLARNTDNIVSLLEEGSKQVVDRKYGLDFLNSAPHRYCIVLSQALKGVGAISKIHHDGTYTTEYTSPELDENGKAPLK